MSNPKQCPRFEHCNANICPLDSDWRHRRYLKNEAVCFYQTEAVKADSTQRFELRQDRDFLDLAAQQLPQVLDLFPAIEKPIRRAKKSGSVADRSRSINVAPISNSDWPLSRRLGSRRRDVSHPTSSRLVMPTHHSLRTLSRGLKSSICLVAPK